tara:strand:+ start:137 stop:649 length:513 start_codon:yes stop_codon:yes gene_type:complete
MKFKIIKTKKDISDKDGQANYLIDADEKSARGIVASLKNKKFGGEIGVFGRDDNFNRRALETLKINYLVSPELGHRKDTLKQRDSGLNHVLAKIAKQNKIEIVIDFADVNKLEGKLKALRLARIIQNIKICRRAKCKMKILDLSGKVDGKTLGAFGFSLGMSSQQVKEAF